MKPDRFLTKAQLLPSQFRERKWEKCRSLIPEKQIILVSFKSYLPLHVSGVADLCVDGGRLTMAAHMADSDRQYYLDRKGKSGISNKKRART